MLQFHVFRVLNTIVDTFTLPTQLLGIKNDENHLQNKFFMILMKCDVTNTISEHDSSHDLIIRFMSDFYF